MGPVRFLHTADWQLGMTRHFLAPEAQARFSAARLDAVRALGALATRLDCAFAIACGDVFESNHLDRRNLARALEAMRALPVPLYLLPGNHDPLDAGSVYRSPTFQRHRPDHVHVLDANEPLQPVPGIWLLPAPWPTRRPLEDLTAAAAARAADLDGLRVVAAHGIVDTLSPDPADPARIRLAPLEQAILDGHVHYVALGDRHSTTSVGSTGRVWYSGAPEATDYGEIDAGQALTVELSTDGTDIEVQPHGIGRWRFVRRVVPLSDTADVDRLGAELQAARDKDRTVLKLGFEGTLCLEGMARLDRLLEDTRDLYAGLELWRRKTDLAVLPRDADFENLGLSGFAAAALLDLRAMAARPGEDAATARDALALLVRLAGKPR